LGAVNPEAIRIEGGYRRGRRAVDYIADFEKAGRRALGRNPRWRPRLRVFHLYFVNGLPYRVVIHSLKISPGTMDYWTAEIKKAVGPELARSGLFPPRKYFRERALSLAELRNEQSKEEHNIAQFSAMER
jgi:hypothetical protein